MTNGECVRQCSPVTGRSWPSAFPSPGALTTTEVRGSAIWLNPSITRSRHLGGIRRRRTPSAAGVQGNSLKLPRASRRFAIGRQGNGQALADVATISLLHERGMRHWPPASRRP